MLTVDGRCHCESCETSKTGNIYRMVGTCTNCGTKAILMLFRAGDKARHLDCPVCACWQVVMPQRLATEDEIPASPVGAPPPPVGAETPPQEPKDDEQRRIEGSLAVELLHELGDLETWHVDDPLSPFVGELVVSLEAVQALLAAVEDLPVGAPPPQETEEK